MNRGYLPVLVGAIIGYSASTAQELSRLSKEKPFSLTGSLSTSTLAYGVAGIEPRRKPFSWMITLSPTLAFYGFTLPFSFTISEKERNFRQPFNQLGASPSYKWATVHLGYRSVTFSPFTLAGYAFLGGGVELTPAILRTGFVVGRFNRPVEEDTLDPEKDTPAFSRYGYSAKLGVGTKSNYLDLIMVKAWDDSNSLRSTPVEGEVLPAENLVVGISSGLVLLKVITFKFDLALSDFTRDLRADTLPSDLNPVIDAFRILLKPRTSTQLYGAGKASLNVQLPTLSVLVTYKRIDPDYKSMGAYFFENDIEGLTVSPSLLLFKRKLRFSGQVSFQNDNLLDRKLATTSRQKLSLTASVSPVPQFGFDLQYSNFGTRQTSGQAQLADSSKLDQVNHFVGVMPRAVFVTGRVSNTFMGSYSYQRLDDHNLTTERQSETSGHSVNLSYQVTFTSLGLTLAPAVTATRLSTVQSVSGIRGISLALNQQLFKNTFGLNVSSSYAWNTTDDTLTSTTLTSRFSVGYRIKNRHGLSSSLSYTGNFSRSAAVKSFTEVEGGVGYDFTF